jgi:hypothetical protein
MTKNAKTPWFRKARPPKVARELAGAELTDAMARVQADPEPYVRIYSGSASVEHLSASAAVLVPLCRASAPGGEWYGAGSEPERRWQASSRRECKLCAGISGQHAEAAS